jgi:hypothetical protein
MPTSSLTSMISSLRTTIEDKSNSIAVLQHIIDKQRSRHANEAEQFERDQKTALEQRSNENNTSLAALRCTAESWIDKNNAAQARINDLKADISSAENHSRERADAIQQSISETKQRMHTVHKQQQQERERVWYEQRKAEIEKLTWKGMSSTIARLLKKHDEACNTIRYDLELAKEKLEVQFENETVERIQSFRHSEEQSSSCVKQKKKELADELSQEHSCHNIRLLKLKTAFIQEEEALKKFQAQDTDTLINQHDTALTKLKVTMDSQLQLSKHLMLTQKGQIEQRHRTYLRDIDKELSTTKEAWAKEYAIISSNRIAERNEQNRKILMQRREAEIKSIIRAGFEKERVGNNNE